MYRPRIILYLFLFRIVSRERFESASEGFSLEWDYPILFTFCNEQSVGGIVKAIS